MVVGRQRGTCLCEQFFTSTKMKPTLHEISPVICFGLFVVCLSSIVHAWCTAEPREAWKQKHSTRFHGGTALRGDNIRLKANYYYRCCTTGARSSTSCRVSVLTAEEAAADRGGHRRRSIAVADLRWNGRRSKTLHTRACTKWIYYQYCSLFLPIQQGQ